MPTWQYFFLNKVYSSRELANQRAASAALGPVELDKLSLWMGLFSLETVKSVILIVDIFYRLAKHHAVLWNV